MRKAAHQEQLSLSKAEQQSERRQRFAGRGDDFEAGGGRQRFEGGMGRRFDSARRFDNAGPPSRSAGPEQRPGVEPYASST